LRGSVSHFRQTATATNFEKLTKAAGLVNISTLDATGIRHTQRGTAAGNLSRTRESPLVPLLAHLSQADIGRYVAGIASAETERHVRICVSCMHRLADAAQGAVRWERRGLLGRLVRTDSSQLVDELLAEIEEELRHHAA
jgi:hypothetical protein